jgi:hypothetical protein
VGGQFRHSEERIGELVLHTGQLLQLGDVHVLECGGLHGHLFSSLCPRSHIKAASGEVPLSLNVSRRSAVPLLTAPLKSRPEKAISRWPATPRRKSVAIANERSVVFYCIHSSAYGASALQRLRRLSEGKCCRLCSFAGGSSDLGIRHF